MTLKPYPKYKPSGVEWLGDVPEHWNKTAIKFMATDAFTLFIDGDWIESKDISDNGLRYITTGNVGIGFYKEQGASYITNETFSNLDCTEVLVGDILISRLNLPAGRACIVPDVFSGRIVTSVDNVIFRPNIEYNKSYLVYLFSCPEYFQHTENLARGSTMQRISRSILGDIRTPIPGSLNEQTTIANFLDRETARIDNLISKQQRMIELLKEKRQAVISHAVTKGLDPTVKMKESGVEWLGEVPEHWEAKRLKYNLSLQTEKASINGQQVIALENIESRSGRYIPTDSEYSGEDVAFVAGDILFGKLRPYLAKVYLCESEGIAFGDLLTFRPVNEFNSRFAFYSMLSEAFIKTVDSSTYGTKMPRASAEFINEMPLATPPLSEQIEIAKYLDSQTSKFDALIEKANQAIELLKERRMALISAAVTGKIDVREAA
jgi:type I restriction enzyme S subunit